MQETNAPSWWKIRLDFNYAILLVLLFTFLLTFYHITNLHISLWDETDYMIAAGKVAEDKNLLYLGAGLKPVYMLGLSLFTFFLGTHELSGFIFSAVSGIFLVYLVYLLGVHLFSKKVAILASLILATTPLFLHFSRAIYSDIFVTLIITFVFLYYLTHMKKESYLQYTIFAFLIAFCYLTKNSAILIAPVFVFAELLDTLYHEKKEAWKFSILKKSNKIVFIGLLSLILILFISFGYSALAPGNQDHIVQLKTAGHVYSLFFEITKNIDLAYYPLSYWYLGTPILSLLALVSIIILFKKRTEYDVLILLWLFYLYLFLSFYPQHRLKLFVMFLPPLSLLIARGITSLRVFASKKMLSTASMVIVLSSLFFSIPLLTFTFDAYKNTADYLRAGGATGIITSNEGGYRFYLRDLPSRTAGLKNFDSLSSIAESDYSHLVLDWRFMAVGEGMDDKSFGLEILEQVKPIKMFTHHYFTEQPRIVIGQKLGEPFDVFLHAPYDLDTTIYIFRMNDIQEYVATRYDE